VSSELLVDAAHLALHHSSFKGEPRGEIAYTRAKYVRRQKGAPPGTVLLTGEKSFVVRIDQARLARLLDSRRDR
jgi:predicted ribosome quality control (RQC) complex YloA/Tae2 family protein